ncbi:unnamed protein product [Ectocarpus sp. CCAP 1310/34]|nr:unnamed protein product [Ectocarpus sp. CCAP 1310/34]
MFSASKRDQNVRQRFPMAKSRPLERRRVASKMAATGRQQRQQLRLFLQRVPCPAKRPLYWELDGGESLGVVLKGKTVIEHPTVYVTLDGKETTERFPTLVADLESNDDIAENPSQVIGELERAMAAPVPATASLTVKEGLAPMDATSSEGEDGDCSSSSSSSSESERESSSSSSSEEDDASDDDASDDDKGDEER